MFIYTVSISILCVSWEELSLTGRNQQICDFYKFLKSKDIVDICKVNFDINNLFIQCNINSSCKHITSDVNTYLYVCVKQCICCVSLCICVISNGSTCKKPDYVSDLGKLDTLLHKDTTTRAVWVEKKVEKQSRGEVGGKIGNVLGFFHTIPPIL